MSGATNGCSTTAGRAMRTRSAGQDASRVCAARKPASRSTEAFAGQIRARMADRVWFVGSNAVTAPQIQAGFRDMLEMLDSHLESRPYLFGGRPAFGDFGLWGQFYELWTDPTAGALIEGGAPHVLDWVHRMLWPRAEGKFETWSTLAPTLMPILTRQVGKQFMPWTSANEKALAGKQDEFTVALGDKGGRKSHKNITRDRSACCAPNMRKSPTRPRSMPFWKPRVAWPDCATENSFINQGKR